MTGSRMIIVASALGFALFLLWASLAQVDEVTRGQGKVIPVEQAADDHRCRAGDGQRVARPLGPAGPARASCWRGSTTRKALRSWARSRPRPIAAGARVAADGRRHGTERSRARAPTAPAKRQLRAARQSALRSKVAGAAARRPTRRGAKPAEAAATISSLQGSLALAQKQVADARAARRQEHRPADRPARQAARSRRPPGPDRRRARAAGQGAWPRSAKRRPRPRRPISSSASRRSTSAARSTPRSRSTSSRCAAPRASSTGPRSARRSTASSTTSR